MIIEQRSQLLCSEIYYQASSCSSQAVTESRRDIEAGAFLGNWESFNSPLKTPGFPGDFTEPPLDCRAAHDTSTQPIPSELNHGPTTLSNPFNFIPTSFHTGISSFKVYVIHPVLASAPWRTGRQQIRYFQDLVSA